MDRSDHDKRFRQRFCFPQTSRNPTTSFIGIVLIVVALPSLYLGATMPGVIGYSLIALSVMALVAALGVGYNLLVKSKMTLIYTKKPLLNQVLK